MFEIPSRISVFLLNVSLCFEPLSSFNPRINEHKPVEYRKKTQRDAMEKAGAQWLHQHKPTVGGNVSQFIGFFSYLRIALVAIVSIRTQSILEQV